LAKPKRTPAKKARFFPAAQGLPKAGKTVPTLVPSSSPSWETHLMLLLGILLVGAVFLQNDPFQWLGIPIHLPLNHLNLLLFVAAVLLFFGFRGLPDPPASPDLPRWAAYPLLLFFLGVTAYMRMYRASDPIGRYWDDPAICIIDPCNIYELHIFRIDFAIGHREPLYPYAAAGIWWLFPQLKGLVVERLTSTLFDVAAVWLFYRLGREVTGKRTVGVLLAALGAVSKPMILQNLGGMPGLTLPFIISLVMWFQFRLFRKPDLSHFLQWGFILGFGFYTYIAYRPWMLFLAFSALAWLFWQIFVAPRLSSAPAKAVPAGRIKAKTKAAFTSFPQNIFKILGMEGQPSPELAWLYWGLLFLVLAGLAGMFLFLLDRLFVVFAGNRLSAIWSSSVWGWLGINALLFGVLGYLYFATRGMARKVVGWCLGVFLAGFLVYPLAMNEEIGIKIRDISILPKNPVEWLGSAFLHSVWARFAVAVKAVFLTGEDRADMNVVGDPFFDFQASVLALAGLVFAVSRFSWKRVFLVFCVFTGMVGRVLTNDPTSAKLLGSLPALLLLSSWGLGSWLLSAFTGGWKKRWIGLVLTVALAGLWVWEGQTSFERIYVKWWGIASSDVIVSDEISRQLPTKRVYLALYNGMGYASPAVQGVIHDGEPLYLLGKTNTIDVTAGETPKDVAVVLSGQDKEWAQILKKDFPKAQWLPQWAFYQSKADNPFLYTVVIPAADIPKKPGKLFMLRVAQDPKWLRRVYGTSYGLCRGMISYEDLSPVLNPVPPGSGSFSISAEGDWEAPTDGNYSFSVNSANPLQIWVDGQKALSSITAGWVQPRRVTHTIHLTKGVHHIRYLTFLRSSAWFDRVTIENRETGFKDSLGG